MKQKLIALLKAASKVVGLQSWIIERCRPGQLLIIFLLTAILVLSVTVAIADVIAVFVQVLGSPEARNR